MNSESFADYLAQPAKLYQLPYQEIKNLVAEYPYAANLRLLMLIKSKIEQDAGFESHLHQLAARTFDRDFLFDLDRQGLKQMLDLAADEEERLELKDLSAIPEKDLETVPIETRSETEETPLKEHSLPNPVDVSTDFNTHSDQEEWVEDLPTLSSTPTTEMTTTPTPVIEEKRFTFKITDDLVAAIALIPTLTSKAKVQSKEDFPAWQQFLKKDSKPNLSHLKKLALKNSKEGSISTQKIAANSIKQKPSVATETLAKLLEKQGNYAKAIKMYEQLSLLNPEKSRYFAATIEKLKLNI